MLNLFNHSPLVAVGQAAMIVIFGALMLLSARRSRPNIQWDPKYRQLLSKAYEDCL